MTARRRTQPLVLDISANIAKADAGVKALRSTMLQLEQGTVGVQDAARQAYDELSGGAALANVRQIDAAYARMMRNIQNNARQIAASGSPGQALNLLDIQATREQVEESSRLAAVYRAVANEAEIGAQEHGEYRQELLQLAAATAIEAEREDQRLKSLTRTLGALEALGGATEKEIARSRRSTVSAGQQRAGYQQLGFQVNDIALQFSLGVPVAQIFGQQLGQVTQAMSLLSNESRGFLGFLAGPWGIALGAAAVILAPFVARLFEGNDALADAVDKLRDNAHETDINRRAQEAFNRTLEGRIARQRELNRELRESIRSERQRQIQNLHVSQAELPKRQARRDLIEPELDAARSSLRSLQHQLDEATGDKALRLTLRVGKARDEVRRLEGELSTANARIAETEASIRLARIPLIERDIEIALDRRTAATERYTEALDRLNRQLEIGPGNSEVIQLPQADGTFRAGRIEGIDEAEYRRRRQRLEEQRLADDERLSAEERAANRSRRGAGRDDPRAVAEALERAFQDRLARANAELVNARRDAAATPVERRRIEQELIAGERAARDLQLEREVIDGELTQAQAGRLRAVYANRDAIEDATRAAGERQEALDRQLETDLDAIDAQGTLLGLQLDFADTLEERRRIARQLLTLEFEERRRVAQRLLRSTDPEDQAAGRRELDRIEAERPFRERQIAYENADPLQRYFLQLERAVTDTDTAFAAIAANGLQGFEDALVGVISGTASLSSAFKRMTASILADIARLLVQRAIFSLLGNLIGGFGGQNSSGGLGGIYSTPDYGGGQNSSGGLGGIYSTPGYGGAGFGGFFADGGLIPRGSFGIVGERGPEIVVATPRGAMVHANPSPGLSLASIRTPSLPDPRGLRAANDDGVLEIRLGEGLEAQWLEKAGGQTVQIVRASQPETVAAARSATLKALTRRPL